MPATQAQVDANRANALKSTGPRIPEGKDASRANSLKHGLTGAGTVLPQREAAEVDRRASAFESELRPSGELGLALVRRVAVLSVRMERCNEHETAALTERVRQAEADFVVPEGLSPTETHRLLVEVAKRALFDPSREACLARKYEQAAERGFFRALKELRQHEESVKAAEAEIPGPGLGSFSTDEMTDDEFDALYPEPAPPTPRKSAERPEPIDFATLGGRVDVPITIGRRR